MQQHSNGQSQIWPVVFPDETLIIKRPCLRYICQGNTDVGELLSYFLYEAGKEAVKRGINPQTVTKVVLYRVHDVILYGLDYSVAENALARNIKKLEQLGFLEAIPREYQYTVHVEKINEAINRYKQTTRRRPPPARFIFPPTEVYIAGQLYEEPEKEEYNDYGI